MGQNNQTQNQNQEAHSFCCLSRRYLVHKNIQKQNKIQHQKQKSACLNNNELQIYSKQRFRDENYIKPPEQNPYTLNKQPNFAEHKITNQKHFVMEEIANLGLQSNLLDQKQIKDKNTQLKNEKKQIHQLLDVLQQNQKIQTRQTSIWSKDLSHRKSISTNNQKLKNKIQNLKLKYSQKSEQPSNNEPSQIHFPADTKTDHTRLSKHKNLINQISESGKLDQSEKIQFFSQNSDSQEQSSSEGAKSQGDYANQQMLSSRKIELMVNQLKIKERMSKKKNIVTSLQRIPEESQKIHSSKSDNQLSNHISKPSHRKPILQQRIQQQAQERLDPTEKQQIMRDEQKKSLKSVRNHQYSDRDHKFSSGNTIKQCQFLQNRDRKEGMQQNIQILTMKISKSDSQKKINNKTPRSSKKIIPF